MEGSYNLIFVLSDEMEVVGGTTRPRKLPIRGGDVARLSVLEAIVGCAGDN